MKNICVSVHLTAPTVNACASNPCYNGGTCSSYNGSFYCACHSNYYGNRCQNGNITRTLLTLTIKNFTMMSKALVVFNLLLILILKV